MPQRLHHVVDIDHDLPEVRVDVRRRELARGALVEVGLERDRRQLVHAVDAQHELADDLVYLAAVQNVGNVRVARDQEDGVVVRERQHVHGDARRLADGELVLIGGEQPVVGRLRQQLLHLGDE